MLNVQLFKNRSSQNVLDKFLENINDSKRGDKEYRLKNNESKSSENMRIILEFPAETDKENDSKEDLKDAKRMLSEMLENFIQKTL